MRDGVDQRFKHCSLTELRAIYAGNRFRGSHPHIALDKMQCLHYLRIKRPHEVASVKLVIHIAARASVADYLGLRVRQPPTGVARTHEDTSNCEPWHTIFIGGCNAELLRVSITRGVSTRQEP